MPGEWLVLLVVLSALRHFVVVDDNLRRMKIRRRRSGNGFAFALQISLGGSETRSALAGSAGLCGSAAVVDLLLGLSFIDCAALALVDAFGRGNVGSGYRFRFARAIASFSCGSGRATIESFNFMLSVFNADNGLLLVCKRDMIAGSARGNNASGSQSMAGSGRGIGRGRKSVVELQHGQVLSLRLLGL